MQLRWAMLPWNCSNNKPHFEFQTKRRHHSAGAVVSSILRGKLQTAPGGDTASSCQRSEVTQTTKLRLDAVREAETVASETLTGLFLLLCRLRLSISAPISGRPGSTRCVNKPTSKQDENWQIQRVPAFLS